MAHEAKYLANTILNFEKNKTVTMINYEKETT